MPEILFRIVEGACVALYRHEPRGKAEAIPARGDLYAYSGGFAWGGTGAAHMNLSCAIVGKLYGFGGHHRKELTRRARILQEQVLARLDTNAEHDVPVATFHRLFE